MTLGKRKKYGFVVDLNIHRHINILVEYASDIKPNASLKEALNHILRSRLVTLYHRDFNYSEDTTELTDIVNKIYEIYDSNPINVIKHQLDRIRNKVRNTTEELQNKFNDAFSSVKSTKQPCPKKKDKDTGWN